MRQKSSVTDAADMVALNYVAPPPDLMRHFGALYFYRVNLPQVTDQTRADFAQIRFMLSGQGHYRFGEGHVEETPTCCLLGPTSTATHFDVAGPMHVVGVTVLPLGWAALGAGGADEASDHTLDLVARFGTQWRDLYDRLCQVETAEQAADMLWPFLRAQLRAVSPAEERFVEDVDRWLADEQSPRVDALLEATGLSARQVARLCNRFYGAPPKYLARKYRALRCAQILARRDVDWTEFSGEAFYDQSHFIREIKEFIGLTPTELREKASLTIHLSMERADLEGELARLSRIS